MENGNIYVMEAIKTKAIHKYVKRKTFKIQTIHTRQQYNRNQKRRRNQSSKGNTTNNSKV